MKNHAAALSPADGLAKPRVWSECLENAYVPVREGTGNKIKNNAVAPRPDRK